MLLIIRPEVNTVVHTFLFLFFIIVTFVVTLAAFISAHFVTCVSWTWYTRYYIK